MHKHPLAGKVALITGSARRIGAAIARLLHQEGIDIALHYNASEEEAFKLCEEFNTKRKQSAAVFHADLQAPESDKGLINNVFLHWKRLDILVNNASRYYRTQFGEVTEYAWDDLLNSNLKAPFFLAQAAYPYLKKSKGTIVNVGDVHAASPLQNYSVYCISKSGLLMMTKVLAKELGPEIRVNAVSPGAIIWPEGENVLSEVEKKSIVERTALLRVGDPSDIAKAVLFFIRDADYITGQVLSVDGGRTL